MGLNCIILPQDYEGEVEYRTINVLVNTCLNDRGSSVKDFMIVVVDEDNKVVVTFSTYDYSENDEEKSDISSEVGEYIMNRFNGRKLNPVPKMFRETFIKMVESENSTDTSIERTYQLKVHIKS